MKIFGEIRDTRALVIDIDNTVYDNSAYFRDGNQRELEDVACYLGQTPEGLESLMQTYRSNQIQVTGRKPTMTETVYHFGLTSDQWSRLRCEAWRPEAFLHVDHALEVAVRKTTERWYAIVFATNSPKQIGERVLRCLGLGDMLSKASISVFGPEDVHASKHQPEFFRAVAEQLRCFPGECVSIGDREDTEARVALEAGYSAAYIIFNVTETITLLHSLCNYNGGVYERETGKRDTISVAGG